MKAYTDISQSKNLAEILPLESADMYYTPFPLDGDGYYDTPNVGAFSKNEESIYLPCWSLAALFDLLPNNEHIETSVSRGSWKIDTVEYVSNTWWCEYEDNKNQTEFNVSADNPVDACVNMILKLKEKNLL